MLTGTITIDNSYIELEDEQLLLGKAMIITLFLKTISIVFAIQKLNTLKRISPYMNVQKQRTIMKSFVTSQFGCCLLLWMFHSRRLKKFYT